MSGRGHAAALAGLFLAVGFTLFLLNGWNAYHPTDDGFILAYSWRVASGEVPYRDFLYERMPLSPYLHLLELLAPEGLQIQAGRLTFYLELALSGALPAVWAARRLGTRATSRALTLTGICFLLAVHNFPPMPWPTVDAVFFASAGVTAFLFSFDAGPRRALALRAAASALLALAVLAKQAFAPLPLLFAAYALAEAVRTRSPAGLVASVAPGALLGCATLAALAAAGALPEFLQQIAEPTRLRPSVEIPWSGDPVTVGIAPYLRALSPLTAALMAVAFGLAWSRRRAGMVASRLRSAGSVALLVAFVVVAAEAQAETFQAGVRLFWVLLAACAGLAASARDRLDRLACLACACVLATAWCASLSFAYQTPLLGLAAAGVFFERTLAGVSWPGERIAVAAAGTLVLAGVLNLQLDRPYRDVPRVDQVADLGEIYPRFGRLHTNRTTYERFAELRELQRHHAPADRGAFVVLPDYPLANFLTGTRNPLSLDWLQPQEYLGNESRLIDELETKRPTVFVQRDVSLAPGPPAASPRPCDRPPEPVSALAAHVVSRWTLVATGSHFCVYRSPARLD